MRTIAFVAMLAAFLAAGLTTLTPDRAHADGVTTSGNIDNYHYGGRCDRWARISTSSATCLSSKDEGYLLDLSPSNTDASGYAYWAKNECSDYGTIIAHNDIGGGIDHHWHLEDGEKIRIFGSWEDSKCNLLLHRQVGPVLEGPGREERFEQGSRHHPAFGQLRHGTRRGPHPRAALQCVPRWFPLRGYHLLRGGSGRRCACPSGVARRKYEPLVKGRSSGPALRRSESTDMQLRQSHLRLLRLRTELEFEQSGKGRFPQVQQIFAPPL